ncbi:MAG: PH domain-containing protein [Pseudomonadota bacterium]
MHSIHKIPITPLAPIGLLACVAAVSAAVAWSFRSGLTWTAICLIVVVAPLALLYWYMLFVNPRRAAVTVADEGILLAAPPFASAVIPWASVREIFEANLLDPEFAISKSKKFMHFAGYRSGVVELAGGREAVIVANRPQVLCVRTEDRDYLIGPSDLDALVRDVTQARQ